MGRNYLAQTLQAIDPRTGKVVRRVSLGDGPEGLATDGRSLWVVGNLNGKVIRVDARTGRVLGRVPTESRRAGSPTAAAPRGSQTPAAPRFPASPANAKNPERASRFVTIRPMTGP